MPVGNRKSRDRAANEKEKEDFQESFHRFCKEADRRGLGSLLRRRLFRAFGLSRAISWRVKPDTKLFAGLKIGDVFLRDRDLIACARIAAHAGWPVLDRKRPETAQLDAIAARQRGRDLVEDRGDDALDITLVKMRVGFRKLLNEF